MDLVEIVAVLLVIAGIVRFLFKPGGIARRLLGQDVSQSWPWAKTTIGYGYVDSIAEYERGTVYILTVPYSYSVNGKDFAGEYTESFATEDEAQALLKSVQELPPPVRYKPGNPAVSKMDPYRDAGLGVTAHS